MKFAAVFASLVLAIASTFAAECTMDQLSGAQAKLLSACGSSIQTAALGASATSESEAKAAAKKICQDTTCMNALKDVTVIPDCTFQGMSFKKTFENKLNTIQSECKQLVGSTSSASTLSATTAAAVAAVVVFAQL